MISSGGKNLSLFKEVEALISPLGLTLIEVNRSDVKGKVTMRVILYKKDGAISTEDLENVYNAVYPRYQVLISRDLEMEVSSPGIDRNFKDTLEFKAFENRNVRIYSNAHSSYITGVISSSDDESVTLNDYTIVDKKEMGKEITIPFSDIAKAKLDGGLK